MELRTLGGLSLRGGSFARPKPLVLLAYLAIEGPRSRRFLSELFWPRAAQPMNSLRVAVSQLGRGAPGTVVKDGARLAARVEVDAVGLLDVLEEAAVAAVVRRYRGPFLDGVDVAAPGGELEEWIHATREALADRVRGALLTAAERTVVEGDAATAAARAEAATKVAGAAPADADVLERLHRVLVAADAPTAERVAREARDYGLVLSSDRAGARATLLASVAPDPRSGSLPVPLTTFVGRDLERLELARLLNDGGVRLVTLTGAGGIGKSRLALQAAHDERGGPRFEDGVAFASLASLASDAHLADELAGALGVALSGPVAEADLVRALRGRAMLLVLDDCEHLATCGAFTARLLSACPRLAVLATSRVPLGVAGEQRFAVSGLAAATPARGDGTAAAGDGHRPPHLEAIARADAVQLFVQRGRRVRPGFELTEADAPHVQAICRLVEGSPLGIELAAAWLGFLAPREIAAEIGRSLDFLHVASHGVADRHTSLRATFEHSWRLLSDAERATSRRLSVFEGGFGRAAASRVAGATIPLLASLFDRSLLRRAANERYERHPLVHEFTAARLAEDRDEERATRAAHAAYFLELAEEAAALPGPSRPTGLARLARDHDNLRAALRWTLHGGDAATGLALAARLYRYWYYRSHFAEGLHWLGLALERTAEGHAPLAPLRAEAMHGAGVLALERGDPAAARRHFEARLALAAELGDDGGRAATLNSLGVMAWDDGDLARAQALFEESRRLRCRTGSGDPAVPLGNLGLVALTRGDHATARSAFEATLRRARDAADAMGEAIACCNLAAVHTDTGDPQAAATRLRQAVAGFRALGDRDGLAHCLEGFAAVATLEGRFEVAARWCGAAAAFRERIGAPLAAESASLHERRVRAARRALAPAEFARAAALGRGDEADAALDAAMAGLGHGPSARRS